jgi:hypothetical protein
VSIDLKLLPEGGVIVVVVGENQKKEKEMVIG